MFLPSMTNLSKVFLAIVTCTSLCSHHNVSMAEVDLNERMQSWSGKKRLKCLNCEMSLFGYHADSSEFISSHQDGRLQGDPQVDPQQVYLS